ncbi:membrane protein [Beggiatoa sp. PS]|nr:membrane protein [Beggiatoa sp. PS]
MHTLNLKKSLFAVGELKVNEAILSTSIICTFVISSIISLNKNQFIRCARNDRKVQFVTIVEYNFIFFPLFPFYFPLYLRACSLNVGYNALEVDGSKYLGTIVSTVDGVIPNLGR